MTRMFNSLGTKWLAIQLIGLAVVLTFAGNMLLMRIRDLVYDEVAKGGTSAGPGRQGGADQSEPPTAVDAPAAHGVLTRCRPEPRCAREAGRCRHT